FSSRRRHTRFSRDWSSDVCSSDLCSSASSPRSRPRPTTPCRTTGSISSGNRETTPKRYISRFPEALFPVDDDDAAFDVDLADDVRHPRDQPVAAAGKNHHVVRSGRHHVIDLAEDLAAEIADRQPLEVDPVVLARLARRQRRALHPDLRAEETPGLVAIIDAAQLRDHVLAGGAPGFDLHPALGAVVLEDPFLEADDVLARLGVRVDLDPALDAEQAAHAADADPFRLAGALTEIGVGHPCRFAPAASGGRSRVPILLDQLLDALGHLGPVREPVLRPLEIDLELALASGRNRVEEAEALDVTAVAAVAAGRHHHVSEWVLLCSAGGHEYR